MFVLIQMPKTSQYSFTSGSVPIQAKSHGLKTLWIQFYTKKLQTLQVQSTIFILIYLTYRPLFVKLNTKVTKKCFVGKSTLKFKSQILNVSALNNVCIFFIVLVPIPITSIFVRPITWEYNCLIANDY